MAEFQTPTQQEFRAITQKTTKQMCSHLLAVSARYDRRFECVMIVLNNGTVVGFPLSALPGLEQANADDLRKIEIEGGGYGLHIESLDADISVPSLLADYLGSKLMKTSVSRANASRSNGKLGGRPTKEKAA
jgi:Protein of unknown function (DUF2442)